MEKRFLTFVVATSAIFGAVQFINPQPAKASPGANPGAYTAQPSTSSGNRLQAYRFDAARNQAQVKSGRKVQKPVGKCVSSNESDQWAVHCFWPYPNLR